VTPKGINWKLNVVGISVADTEAKYLKGTRHWNTLMLIWCLREDEDIWSKPAIQQIPRLRWTSQLALVLKGC